MLQFTTSLNSHLTSNSDTLQLLNFEYSSTIPKPQPYNLPPSTIFINTHADKMGQSWVKIKYPPGCWSYSGPTNANEYGPIPNFLMFSRTWDCDCHKLKTCTWGEPTIPSSWEFQNDPNYQKLQEQDLQPTLKDRLPGSELTEPPPHADAPTMVMVKRSTKEELRVPREYAYAASLFRAWHALPPVVQNNISNGWNTLDPYMNDFNLLLSGPQILDPRPSLAILLDDARGRAGDVIRIMSKKDANLLLYCAQEAFDHVEDVSFPEALETTDKGLLARKDREHYINILTRFITLWRAHHPVGLSHYHIPNESYTFTTVAKNNTKVTQRLKAEEICQSVWNKAVNETDRSRSYVSEFEKSFEAIDALFDAQPDVNTYIKALDAKKNWPKAEKLDWSTKNLKKVFGKQTPEVQVALSYFALSLWTGATKYTE